MRIPDDLKEWDRAAYLCFPYLRLDHDRFLQSRLCVV